MAGIYAPAVVSKNVNKTCRYCKRRIMGTGACAVGILWNELRYGLFRRAVYRNSDDDFRADCDGSMAGLYYFTNQKLYVRRNHSWGL